MATAELKVRIEADLKNYQDALIKSVKDTDVAANQIEKAVGGVSKSFTVLNSTKFTFGQNYVTASQTLANQAQKTSQILGGSVAAGSNQAAFALTNLGRVAQDAPFGFIGIQNNIPPLIEAFQRLKATSGGTGNALKALGASLVGSGGLLLAVSLVTSALTVLAQNPEKVAGALNYLSGAVDNATASQKAYNDELIETSAAAKVEITSLTGLIDIARNETLSRNARLEALKKVKAEYPEQLEFLTLETIGSKRASEAIDLLSKSLLRKAKIQAAEKLLGDAFTKQLEATTKSVAEQAGTFSKVVGASLGAVGIKNFVVIQDGIENQAKAFNDAGKEITTYSDILKNLKTQESEDGTLFDDNVNKSNKSLKTQSDILKALSVDFKQIGADFSITFGKANEEKVGALKKAINELISIGADSSIIQKLQSQLLSIDPAQITQKGKEVGVSAAVGIEQGLATSAPLIAKSLSDNLKGGLTEWQTYVNNDLLPKVQTNFETFFNDILMRGKLSFESLGKAILNTFLSIAASDAARGLTNLFKFSGGAGYSNNLGSKVSGLAAIGKALGIGGGAAAGAAVAAGSLSGVAATTGGVILGAPIAAAGTAGLGTAAGATAATGGLLLPILGGIAAGALVASLFKKRKAEPQPAFTTSNAISTSSSSNVDFGNGRVVFEISGVNLVGVLNRAGAKLQRFGP